ncbi:hypothetical protein ACEQ8H_004535 [Pleosporales sp. CAS-2024a]
MESCIVSETQRCRSSTRSRRTAAQIKLREKRMTPGSKKDGDYPTQATCWAKWVTPKGESTKVLMNFGERLN